MKNLLKLQELDRKIAGCKSREWEIPKQKNKFDIHRERLKAELDEREQILKGLVVEQQDCESAIDQMQEQIAKYNGQLNTIKKNEEYQALIHEIDAHKKQIALKEERILNIMMELDEAKGRLEEDRIRIKDETGKIDAECAEIDKELAVAVTDREVLESQRGPIIELVEPELFQRYDRIRESHKGGTVVVPLNDEVCGGCHMHIMAQVVNEVLAGNKVHGCQHCGRLLYHPGNFADEPLEVPETSS